MHLLAVACTGCGVKRSVVARRRDKQAILDSPDMLNDGIKARNTSDHVVNKDRWP